MYPSDACLAQYRLNYTSLPPEETAILSNFLVEGEPSFPAKKRRNSEFGTDFERRHYTALREITGDRITNGLSSLNFYL